MQKRSIDSKEKLIISGIELYSKYGIEGASLRSVNWHSGSSNNSAAHYHFATKESFLTGIIEFMFQITKEELNRFVEHYSSQYNGLELAIFNYVSPLLLIFQNRSWGRSGVKFLAAILTSTEAVDIRTWHEGLPNIKSDFISNMQLQFPNLDTQEISVRAAFMWTNLIFGLASAETMKNTVFGDFSETSDNEQLSALISYCAAGFSNGEVL